MSNGHWNPLWRATLRKGSPGYEKWRNILESDDVPLVSPVSVIAQLQTVEVYELDVTKLSHGQIRRLAQYVAEKCGQDAAEILADIQAEKRFPIRAEDVIVAFRFRAFI